ncbi:MAG: tetratricopeptide repeat protein [Bacteroidales bacterium]|nr:tetratricopeptide repeat protein [Bacteroidales bacterium]
MRKILTYAAIFLSIAVAAQPKRSAATVENLVVDAVSLLEAGDVQTARKLLELLRKEAPGDDAVHYYLGVCSLQEGKLDEAESSISKAASLDTANLWYKEALASVYSAKGENAKTAEIYIELMRKAPSQFASPYTYTILGDKELQAWRDSSALSCYERALEMEPGYAPALLGKAEIYRMRGNYPSFFVSMDEFVRDENIIPAAKAHYLDNLLKHVDARVYRGWGAQLDSLVDAGVRSAPADSTLLKLAGQWYYGTGRKEKGKDYFRRLHKAWPEDMSANMINIQLLSEEGKTQEVIGECRRMLGFVKGKDRITVLSVMGDSYHLLGDSASAFKIYEKVLQEDPGHAPVLNNYAYYLSQQRRKLRKAEKMSRVTIEKDPDNPTYLDTYGWILHLLGKDAEAKIHFKRAIVYGGSDSAVILGHYAEVLRALGEEDLARYYESQAARKQK